MAQPPTPSTLGSNNPFRRKTAPTPPTAPGSVASASPAPQQPPTFHETDTDPSAARVVLPSGDEFWNQLQGDLSHPSQPPPTTSFQKPKVVKRVRVQSPAPSSPESAGGPRRVIESESDDDSDSDSDSESVDSAERLDPFTGAPSLDSVRETGNREDIVIPVSTFGTPPPNPFQTTGKDLRGTAQIPDPPGSGGTRGGLDVGAFGRLLLTGQTGGAAVSSQHIAHQMVMGGLDGGSNTATDASSISRQSSILDQPRISQDHTPRTSHEISEQEPEDENRGLISKASTLQPAPTILRKKPPPPSSRHGKLIKQEPSQPAQPARSLLSPTPRDINKPLPFSPEVEETTNIFDHSAAGKVPEPRPPTPPQPSRKPPPPAPRRQSHKQQTSVGSALTPAATPNSDDIDPLTRRSSVDSVRSRSSSLRVSVHAPPPAPPPRRPGGHGRGASSSTLSSPPPPVSALSPASDAFGESPLGISGLVVSTPPQISGSGTPDGTAGAGASGGSVNMHHLHSKLSPPPPPPARNSSVRTGGGSKRPVSLSERKGSAGGIGGLKSPAPPVPRHRGEGLRAGSTGSVGSLEQKVGEMGSSDGIVGDVGQSVDILADLTRLQREVDALRAGLAIAGAGQEGTEGIPGKRNGTI